MLKKIFVPSIAFAFSLSLTAADVAPSPWLGKPYLLNNIVQGGWARPFLDKIPLKGDERILNLGCGDGKNTKVLFDRVTQGLVYGVDKSASTIAAALKHAENSDGRLKFLVQDMTECAFEPDSFDVVVSTTALHWVEIKTQLFGMLIVT